MRRRFIRASSRLLLGLLAVGMLAGCPLPMSEEALKEKLAEGLKRVLSHLGIEDARTLIIAEGGSGRTLLKIDVSGLLSAVAAKDDAGAEVNDLAPDHVFNVTPEFVLLSAAKGSYLVRRSDGKSALLEEGSLMSSSEASGSVRADDAGNVFYLYQGVIKRITPGTGVDQLVKTSMTNPEFETADAFTVDGEGNVLAFISPKAGFQVLRLYLRDGGIRVFKLTEPTNPVRRLVPTRKGFGVQEGNGAYFLKVADGAGQKVSGFMAVANSHWAAQRDRAIAVMQDPYMYSYNAPKVFVLKESGLEKLDLAGIWRPQGVAVHGETLYILGVDQGGKTKILRYDLGTRTEQVLFEEPADYQVLGLSIDAAGGLLVSAQRLSDGASVVGTIDAHGKLSILSSAFSRITQIQPLE